MTDPALTDGLLLLGGWLLATYAFWLAIRALLEATPLPDDDTEGGPQ